MSNRHKLGAGIVVAILCLCFGSWLLFRSESLDHQTGAPPAGSGISSNDVSASTPAEKVADVADSETAEPSAEPSEKRAPLAAAGSERALAEPTQPGAAASAAPSTTASAEPSATTQASVPPADAGTDAGRPTVAAVASQKPPAQGTAIGQFRDRVGPTYRLISVACLIDGRPVYTGSARNTRMFNLRLNPGSHTISVVAKYQGHGGGVFSYADKYQFTVNVGGRFLVRPNRATSVMVRAYERGGPTGRYEDRLALAVAVR